MLQQEQDRREIPDRQMLLLPWTGGGNNESGPILCRWYGSTLIMDFGNDFGGIFCTETSAQLPHLSLYIWCLFQHSEVFILKEKWFVPGHFIHLALCLEVTSDRFKRVDRCPGNLTSCQQWPQLHVNRSMSSLLSGGALT